MSGGRHLILYKRLAIPIPINQILHFTKKIITFAQAELRNLLRGFNSVFFIRSSLKLNLPEPQTRTLKNMRKLLRLIARIFLFFLFIILGIIIINTLSYSSQQLEFEAVQQLKVDEAVAERLGAAIRIPTNSWSSEKIDTQAFVQFLSFVEKTFPLADSLLKKTVINEYSLVYKWSGNNTRLNPILLIGHYDVVPVEEASFKAWEQKPYSGLIKEGFIWGRGAMDDKLSVIGLLETVELMLRNGYEPERTIYFAFGHDEEVSGLKGAQAIARQFRAQGIQFEYVLDEGGMTLNKAIAGLSQPISMIGIAEKGYTTLTLSTKLEEGGHSSMPPKETAISILSQAVLKLSNHPMPAQMNGAVSTLFFDHIGPELDPIMKAVFANRWLFRGLLERQMSSSASSNAMIRTTTAPTILRSGIKANVLPTAASAQVNFRIIPGDSIASVIAHAKKVINDERISVYETEPGTSSNPSPISSPEEFGFKVIQKTIQQIMPKSVVTPNLVIAATDARYYYLVSDNVYRYTPILIERSDLSRFHGINERLSVENYTRLIAFYYQLIKNSCS